METILLNFSNLKVGGGLQVAHSFLNVIKGDKSLKYIVVLSSNLFDTIHTKEYENNFQFIKYDIKATPLKTIFSKNKLLDNLLEKHNVEKVFTLFGPSYWRPKVKHICGYAKPQYVYKESPFFKTLNLKEKIKLKIKEYFHLLDFKKNTDILITENPDVTNRISKITNKKTYTVTNYYNQVFDDKEQWKQVNLPKFDGKYLLTISSNYPHKNLSMIPLVIKELLNQGIEKYKFVITLNKGDLNTDETIDKYIVYLGKVNIDECPSLYQQSDYMFLPTLLECFSASYAEAMRMEKIILTSDISFARGICKDAAIYFSPLNPKDIVQKILEIDSNTEKQIEIIKESRNQLKTFDNYKQRAEKYLKIITEK